MTKHKPTLSPRALRTMGILLPILLFIYALAGYGLWRLVQ